jgi:putative ABC transport system substrate-binding protein
VRRREFITLISGVAAWPLAARAQQGGKTPYIGYLSVLTLAEQRAYIDAMQQGFHQLGYEEGKNLRIDYRWAEGRYDRLSALAAELVNLKVDVLVTHGTPGAVAVKKATSTIPIVAIGASDPVNAGLASSLHRPGGNLTGLAFFFADICAKRVELMKEAIPEITRMAVLINPNNETFRMAVTAMEKTAHSLGVNLISVQARTREEIAAAVEAAIRERAQALVVIEEPILTANAKLVANLAAAAKLPMIGFRSHAEAGGLMGYGVDLVDLWFRSAYFVDKILRGESAAELPIEQATKFDFILNLKAAKALGLEVPTSILLRASEVIE